MTTFGCPFPVSVPVVVGTVVDVGTLVGTVVVSAVVVGTVVFGGSVVVIGTVGNVVDGGTVEVVPVCVVCVPVDPVAVVLDGSLVADLVAVVTSARPTPAAAANARPITARATVLRRKRCRSGTGFP